MKGESEAEEDREMMYGTAVETLLQITQLDDVELKAIAIERAIGFARESY